MNKILVLLVCGVFGIGCSTAQKERREARDRVASQAGLLCDFVNESDFKDVDIELNLRMGNKCNSAKPFSISGYKRLNESSGFMFCCATKEGGAGVGESAKASIPVDAKAKEAAPQGKE
jgi:hypothetical protein